MKKHTKIYYDHFDYAPGEFILCEVCGAEAVDIHHIIYKSRGGKDEISNLMALCRTCHDLAHKEILKAKHLKRIHNGLFKD